jgi:type III restriction enzyme
MIPLLASPPDPVAFQLFDFQTQAAAQLSEAADEWVNVYATEGVLSRGKTPVPFFGHLKAVTGAGKTPILAKVCGQMPPSLILWTSVSSAVVEQTYRNLQKKYRHLLPASTQIIRERPSKSEWEQVVDAAHGLTIWVTTVGSWNEAEAAEAGGSENARLNMHRPQPDWGGKDSPWQQLTNLKRGVWVVYDESHNQTPVQLDQLARLKPIGMLMASATPPEGGLYASWAEMVEEEGGAYKAAWDKGKVHVATKDVVEAQLLKHTIDVENFDSDPESLLDASVALQADLKKRAGAINAPISPKALYIVEKSNPARGETISRPVAIWEYLREAGVDAGEIAIYTQTKTVPDEAEKISSLNQLEARHTHIICNRALQEGWDDPETYIEYFDDESNSFVRIRQIIGRVLRQPDATHFSDHALNTATLFVRVPNQRFDEIVAGIKEEMSLYATDESDPYGSSAIRVRTKNAPLPDIAVKAQWQGRLTLPNYQLGQADLDEEIKKIKAMANQVWDQEALLAPGLRRTHSISLRGEDDQTRYEIIASNTRRRNGDFLRRRIQARSRHCVHLLDPKLFSGEAYDQRSCTGSTAQTILGERANAIAERFESTVELVQVEITGEETWTLGAHQPSVAEYVSFNHAAHPRYSRAGFNKDELEFAQALDSLGAGIWGRNPSRGAGYGIELPVKVGSSNTFYPDFLWWLGDFCYAIDTTGAHILEDKVRGKLLSIDQPQIVLLTRGRVSKDWSGLESNDGWTIARPLAGRAPTPSYAGSLKDALEQLLKAAPTTLRDSSANATRT